MSYARTAVTRMTLDMSRLDLQRSETVTQGDTNRRWEVTLINGGAPFRLPPNWTAALTGIKPDGTGLLNGCSVADGKIIYDFAAGAEIATCAGSYPVQFDIWDEVGDLVASPKIYVNVLEDVRPREGIKSESEYGLLGEFIAQKNELIANVTSNTTRIGDLIGRVNQTDADVDLLGETALAQGDDIAFLKEKGTTSGMVTIPVEEWSGAGPHDALVRLGDNPITKGCVVLMVPEDNATKEAAGAARMSVFTDYLIDGENSYGDFVMVVRAESGIIPAIPLNFRFVVIKTDTEDTAIAAMVGVDAYGEGGGSGVDENAVKKIINSMLGNVANERQYSAANPPPYPVTSVNGQSETVNLSASDVGARPSNWTPTAADVKADPVGTAESMTSALRQEVNTQLAAYDKSTAVNNKISEHNVSTASHEDIRLLIRELCDEINKFLNVDDSTRDELSEVLGLIDANAESLESITVSKVNVKDIVDNLTTPVNDKPLSAAQGVALKLLIDDLDAIVAGKVTEEQLSAALANIPRKLSDLEGDTDHRTVTDLQIADIATAKSAAAKAVPRDKVSLAIHTDGLLYIFVDGAPVGQGVEVGAAIDADIIGTLVEDKNILLEGDLADGTYTITYKSADGTVTAPVTMIVGLAPSDNKADPTSSDWAEGSRLTTSGTLETYAGMSVTNYIEVAANDEVRFENFNVQRVQIANSSKTNLSTAALSTLSGNSYIYSDYTVDESGGYFKVKVASAGYIRLSGWVSSGQTKESVIITVNRVIPASL